MNACKNKMRVQGEVNTNERTSNRAHSASTGGPDRNDSSDGDEAAAA